MSVTCDGICNQFQPFDTAPGRPTSRGHLGSSNQPSSLQKHEQALRPCREKGGMGVSRCPLLRLHSPLPHFPHTHCLDDLIARSLCCALCHTDTHGQLGCANQHHIRIQCVITPTLLAVHTCVAHCTQTHSACCQAHSLRAPRAQAPKNTRAIARTFWGHLRAALEHCRRMNQKGTWQQQVCAVDVSPGFTSAQGGSPSGGVMLGRVLYHICAT